MIHWMHDRQDESLDEVLTLDEIETRLQPDEWEDRDGLVAASTDGDVWAWFCPYADDVHNGKRLVCFATSREQAEDDAQNAADDI